MSEIPAPSRPDRMRKALARGAETALFNSRWLMAPFYIGLIVSIVVLLLKFVRMLWEFILEAPGAKSTDTILGVLSLLKYIAVF